MQLTERFWAKVAKGDGCWEWQAGKDKNGYGQFTVYPPRRTLRAHRVAYEMEVGPIPDGLMVLHRCDNPSCVRPDHLFTGDAKANSEDMLSKGRYRNPNAEKQSCKRGHPFTQENTYTNRPGRQCRACTLMHAQKPRT
jgi:HNH endonuclease